MEPSERLTADINEAVIKAVMAGLDCDEVPLLLMNAALEFMDEIRAMNGGNDAA